VYGSLTASVLLTILADLTITGSLLLLQENRMRQKIMKAVVFMYGVFYK
jgi:hypothetical protein